MKPVDINTEYELVFGTSNYPTLYELQNEEYRQLRQKIIETPLISSCSSKLPFEDIYNTPKNNYEHKTFEVETSKKVEVETSKKVLHIEDLSICNVITGLQNHTINLLMGILSRLGGNYPEGRTIEINTTHNRHIFWITIAGRCKAYGYYDNEFKNFYIGGGSLISIYDDDNYIRTSSYRNRHRLIEKNGTPKCNYFKLIKKVKCRSAVAAARYVVGGTVDLDLWKDCQGRGIYDIYPELFFR